MEIVFFYFLVKIIFCDIVSIDLGTDSLKVAFNKIVRNGIKTNLKIKNYIIPNLFAYLSEKSWTFGEGAASQCYLYPSTCLQRDNLPLNNKIYFSKNSIKGYQIVALILKQIIRNRPWNINRDDLYSIIVIPPSMTLRQKQYLLTALQIAQINCHRFMTSTYAPIEYFMNNNEYDKWKVDDFVVFIDIGHSGIRISGFDLNEKSQKICLFNDKIGGKNIDENLYNLVINKYNIDITDNYDDEDEKDRIVLLLKLRKAKEKLTDVLETTFEFKSKNITITRSDVESCCEDIKQGLKSMISSISDSYLLKSKRFYLTGGCSKIPCLIKFIKSFGFNTISIDPFYSSCNGACYAEFNYKRFRSLCTNDIILQTPNNDYTLFSKENYDDYNPIVQLQNYYSQQVFSVIDEGDVNNEFIRFRIKKLFTKIMPLIDIKFSLNEYLLPVPNLALHLSISYENVGWEVSTEKKNRELEFINNNVKFRKMPKAEGYSTRIERFKDFVLIKLKQLNMFNLKRITFAGLCKKTDSQYNSCLTKYDYNCPDRIINEIFTDFKSLVNSYVINVDDYNDEKIASKKDTTNDKRKKAINYLKGLILACKKIGCKYNDAEEFMQNINEAQTTEIYQFIGELKERIRTIKKSNNEDL